LPAQVNHEGAVAVDAYLSEGEWRVVSFASPPKMGEEVNLRLFGDPVRLLHRRHQLTGAVGESPGVGDPMPSLVRVPAPPHGWELRLAAVLIAGNWKMYKGPAETAEFCIELKRRLDELDAVDVAVCPPFTSLAVAVQVLAGTEIAVAAQNVHWEPEGAFTGEVSAPMLRELGVYGAIVGHSERRQHFGETDETTAKRARAALDAGLSVIACVGETEAEREAGETEDVLRRQVSVFEAEDNLVVAYEPVWAIGTGKTATPEMAEEAHALIKSLLDVPVLYGGSVKPENAAEILAQPAVDGALVGGASLDVESFGAICLAAARS
jgi:triosephosphate isomerase